MSALPPSSAAAAAASLLMRSPMEGLSRGGSVTRWWCDGFPEFNLGAKFKSASALNAGGEESVAMGSEGDADRLQEGKSLLTFIYF